ncbi:MAG: hypothetical protein V1722_03950 [Candidatus Micrarchaeota archaeon]
MADVTAIIKQMKTSGMSEKDIISNLKELGIENAEEKVAEVLKETPAPKGSLKITKIKKEKEETVDVDSDATAASGEDIESETKELMHKVASTNLGNADEMEDKMDQIIALLKALQEVNKKILESNRELLVKLSKKTDGEKSKMGTMF